MFALRAFFAAPNERTQRMPLYSRLALVVVLAHDVLLGAAAMIFAVKLRYGLTDAVEPAGVSLTAGMVYALAVVVVFPLLGVNRGVWRFTALPDLWRLLQAITWATLVFVPILLLINRLDGFPRSSVLIHLPIAAAMLALPRVIVALSAGGGWRALMRDDDPAKPAAVLVGGDQSLDQFLKSYESRAQGASFRTRGLITLEPGHQGRAIRGRRVLGDISELPRAIKELTALEQTPPDVVIVEAPRARADLESIVEAAGQLGADVVRPQDVIGRNGLTPLDAADLLNRPPRRLDVERVRELIAGKRVLVTGAGGTIGSELTRQIIRLSPAHVTLLDASEYNLYEIDLELRELGWTADAALGDVRDARRVGDVMKRANPDVVLHAAALKHVPLMEQNPHEAFLTNVLGTVTVAEAAQKAGVGAFVLISTDKAVQPTNVMGASKRLAEMFVQAVDASDTSMRALSVRFGNVLGSTGSVAPLFERQIARGGPITVTHPDITRYFMTVQEAAALVLQAAALSNTSAADGGGVFVLDMGEPVRIEDLARQLCRLRGLEPGRDIAIVHTGLRPGEKLHEAIFYAAEDVRETAADGVMVAVASRLPLETLRPALSELIAAAHARESAAMMERLQMLLPDYRRAALTPAQ